MANLHHRSSAATVSAEELLAAVRSFLSAAKLPAVLEDGEELLELRQGEYSLEMRGGRLWLETWAGTRVFARRLVAITQQKPGLLDCLVHRFANCPGRLSIVDLDRPSSAPRTISGKRHNFGQHFRRMLSRQFPAWEIRSVSANLDLQRSFSAIYPRAKIRRGMQAIAAVACSTVDQESGCLTAGLLWHDYLVKRLQPDVSVSLALFLPDGAGRLSAQRLKAITGRSHGCRMFLFNEHGSAGEVDPDDLGNVESSVSSRYDPNRHEASPNGGPILTGKLEHELEMTVRAQIENLDPTLLPAPVYGQVLTTMAGERTLIDLLAIDRAGRLCIIELKATEDLQLPLQALDYWTRIRSHASRGELRHLFPGVPISDSDPRLLLVAPATSFHETNARVLSYFSPTIDVERIGINSEWNRRLTVVMRLKGAHAPISHESERYVDPRLPSHP